MHIMTYRIVHFLPCGRSLHSRINPEGSRGRQTGEADQEGAGEDDDIDPISDSDD